MMDGT